MTPATRHAADSPPYPAHWEADVIASDGGTLHIRPMLPSDREGVLAFFHGLSSRTRYLRYFSTADFLPEPQLQRFVNVDHDRRVALIALLRGQIVAIARYEGTPESTEAEVAFVVADAHQGRGLGSVLLEHLAAAGRERGITRFTAVILAENTAMQRVFTDAGYQPSRHFEGAEIDVEFAIDETSVTDVVRYEREQRTEARSIARLLNPATIAIIGASNDPAKIGHAAFHNLMQGGFRGALYPVNPEASAIGSVPAFATIADVPVEIDLAVVAVPASSVPDVVDQCAARHVHGLVLVSGGFGEQGSATERAAGAAAQRRLVMAARSAGMRVIGPNALGLANTDPSVRLNASLAPVMPQHGRVGFFCQSGALGVSVLGEAARRGLGISSFVSAGNRADVSGNDMLQYWESDEQTDLVLLYMESFGNPRKFARLARRLGRHKPIVAASSAAGATEPSLRRTTVELPPESIQALFDAAGVIRVPTVGDLFDVALLLAAQPLPAGNRLGIVSNSVALSTLAANTAGTDGLLVTHRADIALEATPHEFITAVAAAADSPSTDAVLVLFVPSLPISNELAAQYTAAFDAVGKERGTPVLATFLGQAGYSRGNSPGGYSSAAVGDGTGGGGVPSYSTPERAVHALARCVRYASWRSQPLGELPAFSGLEYEKANALIEGRLSDGPCELTQNDVATLLGSYGIEVLPAVEVRSKAQAQAELARLAIAVALRAGNSVRLHITDATALEEAWSSLDLPDVLSQHSEPVSVQPMAARGVEVQLRIHTDSAFGAVVSFGIGGIATELLGDRAYGLIPLTTIEARALIAGPKAAPLLHGYGGAEPVDIDALEGLALRLSTLADAHPEVADCELRAVAAPSGCVVIDASCWLIPSAGSNDAGPRRLSGV